MNADSGCFPDFEAIKGLLLAMANVCSVEGMLRRIVTGLSGWPHVALARIWLIEPGDVCADCLMAGDCPDRARCLHLVASAGDPRTVAAEAWDGVDGRFRRMPLGVGKVGLVGATGEALAVYDMASDNEWVRDKVWAEREEITGFGGQPLMHQGEVRGVLGVFTRGCLTEENLSWLRVIADHASAALHSAHSFDEVQGLRAQLQLENEYLREEVVASSSGEIVGKSAAHRAMMEQIALVAPTDANVLVSGESGTGKELIAWEIHQRSQRRARGLVRVNCASIPRELFESEFFGHVKGAFTGAVRERAGRFELADGGTIFLDEVGEIPLELQSKLLRVLQEGQYERVGDDRTRDADVRVIAATNRDLKGEVAKGRFRQDLYYRLNVFPVEVAPLRERVEDIGLLAEHFAAGAARRLNVRPRRITAAQVKELELYDWPGNVRELQNVVERALIRSRVGDLRFDLPGRPSRPGRDGVVSSMKYAEVFTEAQLKELVRFNTERALAVTGGRIYGEDGAAELLGMPPTTLASRVKRLGIPVGEELE